MANTFKIATLATGPDQDNWSDIQTILGEADIPVLPESEFFDFAGYEEIDDGTIKGQGLPKASWHWNAISDKGRDVLKTYCPLASANVYIMTKTNEKTYNAVTGEYDPVWGAYECVMRWPGVEEPDARGVLGLTIEFSMMEEIGEYL